jgi:hypothetical protein
MKLAAFAPIAVVAICLVMAVLSLVTMSLWNWLMPLLFGLKTVTFWQALGLLVLSRFLLGGFHGHRGGRSGFWRHRMRERWERMTPEEREAFRDGMRARWGGFEPPAQTPTAGTPAS